jgi:hypothetical protein
LNLLKPQPTRPIFTRRTLFGAAAELVFLVPRGWTPFTVARLATIAGRSTAMRH